MGWQLRPELEAAELPGLWPAVGPPCTFGPAMAPEQPALMAAAKDRPVPSAMAAIDALAAVAAAYLKVLAATARAPGFAGELGGTGAGAALGSSGGGAARSGPRGIQGGMDAGRATRAEQLAGASPRKRATAGAGDTTSKRSRQVSCLLKQHAGGAGGGNDALAGASACVGAATGGGSGEAVSVLMQLLVQEVCCAPRLAAQMQRLLEPLESVRDLLRGFFAAFAGFGRWAVAAI